MKTLRHIVAVFLIGASLLLGLFIYTEARDETLFVNRLFASVVSFPEMPTLASWVVYTLPDALWMFACALSILVVWNFQWTRQSIRWYGIAACLGIGSEILQLFQFSGGTFDVYDLSAIAMASVLPVLFTFQRHRHE
jgi:hypothetical protein